MDFPGDSIALAGISLGILGGWQELPSGEPFVNPVLTRRHTIVAQLHMVTAHAGWAVIDQHVADTNNGGQTWQALGPRIPTGAFVLLVGVDAHEAGIVVETGEISPFASQYWWTTNTGHTWHAVSLPWSRNAPLIAIQMVTPDDGWILTGVGLENLGSESAVVLKTTNGGRWTALGSSVFPGVPQRMEPNGLPYAFDKSGVSFRSRLVGWVTGGNGAPREVIFDRTTNGGKIFAVQPLPTIDGQGIGETDPPVFTTPQTGWLPVITDGPSGNRPPSLGFEHTTKWGKDVGAHAHRI